MPDSTTSQHYIDRLYPGFEPALKDILVANCSIKKVSAGDSLIEAGGYFRNTMLVLEGRVKLYREGEDGGEFFMYYLEAGSACALSLICAAKHQKSAITAKAVEDTVVLTVPITLMDTLMREYKTWYYFVMETYRSRFEELLLVIDGIVFKGMDDRLEFYLKNQYTKLNTRQLNITHQEIATDLNSSREVISRLLKKMEQHGKVSLHRNFITWLK